MYCSNCGAEASGNFCSRCGSALAARAAAPVAESDWTQEASYRALIARQMVRDLIAQAAARLKQEMSGEEFLNKFVFKGVPVAKPLIGLVLPLYEGLGVGTGKQGAEDFDLPIGRAIVAVLCALASRAEHLKEVTQSDNGCVITAVLPSDMWSFEGLLRVTVATHGDKTRIEMETHVGQMFDWGKSARMIKDFFADVRTFAGLQP